MFRPFRARVSILGPVDPGRCPGLRYFAPLGLTCSYKDRINGKYLRQCAYRIERQS
ncbi:hypothetical protein SBA2_50009 [Acidobacteriia bacterium SbA2]|nr:hypothetical protein SBA2_50009 [Acidobacteriia bacterium SbA2]